MKTLAELEAAETLLVIGLMSGTSADGVDAAYVLVKGCGKNCRAKLLASDFLPYGDDMRKTLLALASGDNANARDFCMMNALLGQRFADACESVLRKAGASIRDVDIVGSHGHTFWHAPVSESYLKEYLTATLQLGDPSAISERIDTAVVSDFRVRDMAAGGQGAPLVPYVDWLLYRDAHIDTALQNIGGIANVTLLPKDCSLEQVTGFDTGPGNMLIDALAARYDPSLRYDPDGSLAARGTPSEKILSRLLADPYYHKKPPKTTGREKYGAAYVDRIVSEAESEGCSPFDCIATATMLTARSIALACERFSPFGAPGRMIVGGGGARNRTLMRYIRDCLPNTRILRNEDLGWDGDSKEAVAFAILAAECVHSSPNNAPGATGAKHPVVMGKISR